MAVALKRLLRLQHHAHAAIQRLQVTQGHLVISRVLTGVAQLATIEQGKVTGIHRHGMGKPQHQRRLW